MALLGGVATIAQLSDWLNRPEQVLIATIDFGPTPETPSVEQTRQVLKNLREGKWIDETLAAEREKLSKSQTPIGVALENFAVSIETRLRSEALSSGDLPDTNGYIAITIDNRGTQAVSDVRVYVPEAELLSSASEQGGPSKLVRSREITIDTIQPQQTIYVMSWQRGNANFYSANNIVVTHSSGVADKVVNRPFGELSRYVQMRFIVPAVIFMTLLTTALITLIANAHYYRQGWRWARLPTAGPHLGDLAHRR